MRRRMVGSQLPAAFLPQRILPCSRRDLDVEVSLPQIRCLIIYRIYNPTLTANAYEASSNLTYVQLPWCKHAPPRVEALASSSRASSSQRKIFACLYKSEPLPGRRGWGGGGPEPVNKIVPPLFMCSSEYCYNHCHYHHHDHLC